MLGTTAILSLNQYHLTKHTTLYCKLQGCTPLKCPTFTMDDIAVVYSMKELEVTEPTSLATKAYGCLQ